MKYSQLFGKTIKTVEKEAQAASHQLLVRAGFVDQVGGGIFSWLPLGKKVLTKVDQIIREEMNAVDGQEVSLPALHPKAYWEKTGRWQSFDALFKTKSRYGQEYALGPTHEEIITPLVGKYVFSYKDLPIFLYQIQTKFRDEPRPKSGVLRGREFGMKDLYSFHVSLEDLKKYYEKVKGAYLKIFSRCGLDAKVTEASGGTFTKKFSHEFNVVTPAGEVDLIYCPKCTFCQNREISKLKAGDKCPLCSAKLMESRAIELGNIFDLGTKFSEDFGLYFTDKNDQKKPAVMGCYGIGDTRLVGAIVEVHHDDKGIIWPKSVAPYQVHLIGLDKKADSVYEKLTAAGVEVLFDDRQDVSAGVKFADADLIGIPARLVVSEKSGDKIEWKDRDSDKSTLLSIEEVLKRLK